MKKVYSGILLSQMFLLAPLSGEQPDLRSDESTARELARNFESVTEAPPSTASYFINALHGERMVRMYLTVPLAEFHAEAVKKYIRFASKIQQARAWKEPIRTLAVPLLETRPVMDGKIVSGEWDGAYEIQGEVPLDAGESARKNTASWRIGWQGEMLYLAVDFVDDDIHAYSNHTKDGAPYFYQGDALEVFIKPSVEVNCYYELLFNPDGKSWVLSHAHNPAGYRVRIEPDKKMPIEYGVVRTRRGYSIEAAIPLRELYGKWHNCPPKIGDDFTMMMVHADLTRGKLTYSAMFPLLYDGHNIFGYAKAILMKGIKK